MIPTSRHESLLGACLGRAARGRPEDGTAARTGSSVEDLEAIRSPCLPPIRLAAVAASALLLSAPATSRAGILLTAEAPGVQAATMPVIAETFNARALGSYTLINSAIGTYTASAPGGMVVAP